RRGDPFLVTLSMRDAPPGTITEVHAPLPPGFRLEQGTNLAFATNAQPIAAHMRVRAHVRGSHEVDAVTAESIDPTGLSAPIAATVASPTNVEVTPRSYAIQKLRARTSHRAASGAFDQGEARLGVDSTDFRELREYAWGDPPNSINWKATARRLSALGRRGGRQSQPVVNEYEKEGKRTVFVLLDGGESLRIGTTLETGLDHGVEGALAAGKFFLARGSRVGAWTFGCRAGPVAPPEAGSGQAPGLERALSPGEEDASATLSRTLRSTSRYFVGAKPLVVIVTRVTPRNVPELTEAARRLRALLDERRHRALPLIIVDVRALVLAPTPSAAWTTARDMVARQDERAAAALRAVGIRVLPWTPGEEDFRKALLRGGLA
ncbi:MAG: DUF58 domain-containing protein, partial [Candidatus Thermoplasmatota archaeon]